MPGQHTVAERETELLDFAAAVLARRSVDQVLEGLPGQQAVGPAVPERRREVPLEPERHRQLLGIVTVAAAHDAEHPQPRLSVTARADSGHAANVP